MTSLSLRAALLFLAFSAPWGAPALRAQDDDAGTPPALAEDEEDEGPPSTLPFAKFKEAVAKVQLPGFRRMPELSTEGDHGLVLADDKEQGWAIMAQRARIGQQLEQGAAGKLSRFQHQGHDAFYARMTDPEGEEMAFILVKYPEYNMGLFITAKPVTSREELMKVLALVQL